MGTVDVVRWLPRLDLSLSALATGGPPRVHVVMKACNAPLCGLVFRQQFGPVVVLHSFPLRSTRNSVRLQGSVRA